MVASSLPPVEIWQKILRHAISVSEFLDPDAFAGILSRRKIIDRKTFPSPMNDEAAYWDSEKTRNCLQLVSKSWDTYLRKFEHRFVRMLDVYHGTIKRGVLKNAIRISFGEYDCHCHKCDTHMSIMDRASTWETTDSVGSMQVEIADLMGAQFLIQILLPRSLQFQQVKTFIAPMAAYYSCFTKLVKSLPNLRHIYGRGFRGSLEGGCGGGFASQTLVTLSFELREDGEYETIKWELPALRYLRVGTNKSAVRDDVVKNAVSHILHAVGGQLLSFRLFYASRTPNREIVLDLWNLCPNLEHYSTSLQRPSPPPYFHPIHTLSIHYKRQLHDFESPPEWPNLRRIVIDHCWGDPGGSAWRSLDVVQRGTVRVEDMRSMTWEEHSQTMIDSCNVITGE